MAPALTRAKRRELVLRLANSHVPRLPRAAQVAHAVRLLLCDEFGFVADSALTAGMSDSGTLAVAESLLVKALR